MGPITSDVSMATGPDPRTRFYLERELGFGLECFPAGGIAICESPQRTDEPLERLRIIRVGDAALASGTAPIVSAISQISRAMSVWELFSAVGVAELERALCPHKVEELFAYTLQSRAGLYPQNPVHDAVRLPTLTDAPPNEAELQYSRQRLPPGRDFVLAFSAYDDGVQVARSGVRWVAPGLVEIGVDTNREHRGQGYGLTVVQAAAQWVLARGAVALYRAKPSNIPSVRIAKRLGFALTYQELRA